MFSVSGHASTITDYAITRKFDGYDTLEFDVAVSDPAYPYCVEHAAISEQQDYIITKIDGNGGKYLHVCADIDLRALRVTPISAYDNTSAKLATTLAAVLPTGWTFVNTANNQLYRTVTLEYGTALDIVTNCAKLYNVKFRFDNRAKTITAIEPASYTLGAAFVTEELNLRKLQYYGDSTGLITRLEARGADGLTFASINGGKTYVENHSYCADNITGWFVDNRYSNAATLLADATAKLAELAVPVRSYECDVVDLKAIDPTTYGAQDLALYNVVSLKDCKRDTAYSYQVVERVEYPHHPEKNVVTLSSAAPKLSDRLQELESEIATVAEDQITAVEISTAVDEATEWITGGMGGNIFFRRNAEGQPTELLILDTDSIAAATKVWRWNSGGLGYSSTGYNGTYSLAMTANGAIVADFVTTGELRSLNGKVDIDLDNGTIDIKNNQNVTVLSFSPSGGLSIVGGGTFSGTLSAPDGTIGGWTIDDGRLTTSAGDGAVLDALNGLISVGDFHIESVNTGGVYKTRLTTSSIMEFGDGAQYFRIGGTYAPVYGDWRFFDTVTFHNGVNFGNSALDIENGGTGAKNAAAARTNLGLGALATSDLVIRRGAVNLSFSGSNYATGSISYSGFSSPPSISLTPIHNSAANISIKILTRTATSCTFSATLASAASISTVVDWIAIGT